MDQLRYREFKILLKPERFFAPERLEEYWEIVGKIAKKCGVGVTTNKDAFHRLIREVLFYDTKSFDLYKNAFILRKRTFYKNGWPETNHELTVKYRHPEFKEAAAVDVNPLMPGERKIKFKEEILTLKNELGGMRSLYSHNCVLYTPNIVLTQGLADIAKIFPSMQKIGLLPKSKIQLVNHMAVEELQVNAGVLDFGHGHEANATIAIWRNRASETSLIGEFAFQAKFKRYEDIHSSAKEKTETFYKTMQTNAPDWVQLGTTKTAMIYGMGKTLVRAHE